MTALTRCAGHTFGVPCEALVPRGQFLCDEPDGGCWALWDERCERMVRERKAAAA